MRLPLLLALLATPLAAQEAPATCTWLRLSPASFEEGACTVEWTDAGARVTMGTRDWLIRDRDRQGQWATVTLNGLEAMRFEIDRTRYSYSTTDLNETLEVQEQ